MDADGEYAAYLQALEWGQVHNNTTATALPISSGQSSSALPITNQPAKATNHRSTVNGWSLPATAASILGNVCDPSLELTDPIPDVRQLFLMFNEHVFSGRLSGVELRWSKTMTRCAGVCSYEGRGGLCSVRLSEPLLRLRPRSDLVNTLLHEMIHAYEFVASNARDHEAHGPTFKAIAARCNEALGSNVTVFHTFHDEVAAHQRHVWRCNGPCQHKPPYFGFVRRAMNRPPQPADWWFEQHKAECGGTYSKVSEPDPEEKKKAAKRSASERDAERAADEARKRSKGCRTIEDMLALGSGKEKSKPVAEDSEEEDIVLVAWPAGAQTASASAVHSAGASYGASSGTRQGAPPASNASSIRTPGMQLPAQGQVVLVDSEEDEEDDIVLLTHTGAAHSSKR